MPQSLSRMLAHLVFSTKHREPWITPAVRVGLHSYLGGVLKNCDCPPIRVGGVADHVHLFFGMSRTLSTAQVVEKVKVASSKWIKEQGPEFSAFHWQSGYGIFSVSQSETGRVEQYVATQEDHHRVITFQEEYRQFLARHGVEYDERYVWD
jgi:REP element-mobilizing transposase RayT